MISHAGANQCCAMRAERASAFRCRTEPLARQSLPLPGGPHLPGWALVAGDKLTAEIPGRSTAAGSAERIARASPGGKFPFRISASPSWYETRISMAFWCKPRPPLPKPQCPRASEPRQWQAYSRRSAAMLRGNTEPMTKSRLCGCSSTFHIEPNLPRKPSCQPQMDAVPSGCNRARWQAQTTSQEAPHDK